MKRFFIVAILIMVALIAQMSYGAEPFGAAGYTLYLKADKNGDSTADFAAKNLTVAEKLTAAYAQITGNLYASGSVGIGSTAPVSNQGFTKAVELLEGTAGFDLMLTNPSAGTDGLLGLLSFNSGNTAVAGINAKTDGATDAGFLDFQTRETTAGGLISRMRIKSNGNMLLGTTTDDGSSKLQIDGSLRLIGMSSAPTGLEGCIYYNSTDKHFYGHNGTTFVQLDN